MPVSRCLVLLALAAAGGAADAMFYTNAPKDIVAQVADLSAVSRVRFFSSADQGKTWQMLKEVAVAPDAKVPPRLEFRPPSDGSYLIATCAVYKKGAPEVEPKSGVIPANALPLTVDTFKPTIGALTAALEKSEAERAIIAVTWSASDAHFGEQPAVIEASSDGGSTWPLAFPGAAQGSAKITVPVPRGTHAVLLRLSAKDLAANLAVSDAQTVVLPPPPDPEVELKKAITGLPTVSEVEHQPSGRTGQSDEARQIAAATEPVHAPAKLTEIPPATASADPSRPDIIAPHATEDALVDPADGGEIMPSGTLTADAQQREAEPKPFKPQQRDVAEDTAKADDTADEPTFLPNPGAEVVLQHARDQAKAGDQAGALATYRRLHRSGQATIAIAEELQLLGKAGDQRGIVDAVDSLPPEYIGDSARLSESRALVALGEHGDALKALSRIRAGAPEAREAMWLIAKCFQAQGKDAQAKRVLATLAKGDDEWAQRAKEAGH